MNGITIAALHKQLEEYRKQTFRSIPGLHIRTLTEAREFVKERGFIFFWPCRGAHYPSLWTAAAGDRPVPDEHDDPGHVTWGWKDEALGKRYWYYSRLLRRRNTMVSLTLAPFFYALSPNYGDPENDYLDQYQRGELTAEARMVYETLLQSGPVDTIELRRGSRLSNQSSDSRFNKALDDLMVEMKVLPVGISQAGGWRYAFIYDLVTRHFPNLADEARTISTETARETLLLQYFNNMGGGQFVGASKLFRWRQLETAATGNRLIERGDLIKVLPKDSSQEYLVVPNVIL